MPEAKLSNTKSQYENGVLSLNILALFETGLSKASFPLLLLRLRG